jgi:hypothetical protein
MIPVIAGAILAPAYLFWGVRCEPRPVRAVRCACGGFARGMNCRGAGRGMSITLSLPIVSYRAFQVQNMGGRSLEVDSPSAQPLRLNADMYGNSGIKHPKKGVQNDSP